MARNSYVKTTKFPFAHKHGRNGWVEWLVKYKGFTKTKASALPINVVYGIYYKSNKAKSKPKQLDLF